MAGTMTQLGQQAKEAARQMAQAPTIQKDAVLQNLCVILWQGREDILTANAQDLRAAQEAGMKPAMADRLRLTEDRIKGIIQGVQEIVRLADPVGLVESGSTRPNGLQITKTRVPLGVVGMIYESRPNVTVDAAALCVKSGNACILRGGKEAIRSNTVLSQMIAAALQSEGLPPTGVQLVEDTSRQSAQDMMTATGLIDVLIPRGGAGLIRSVVEQATVPVIETGAGNCHIYVDADCDPLMAVNILVNAKCSRPSVCNAAETLLVHRKMAEEFLPFAAAGLRQYDVELRGCPVTQSILGGGVVPATEEDYATEFGDYILAVRVVDSLSQAVEHINRYTTGHSEAIVTNDYYASQYFVKQVDAAAVYVNASTRFTDGGEFGLGAEIGISTQKLHTRGPMGLMDLTTIKYLVRGNGQVR